MVKITIDGKDVKLADVVLPEQILKIIAEAVGG